MKTYMSPPAAQTLQSVAGMVVVSSRVLPCVVTAEQTFQWNSCPLPCPASPGVLHVGELPKVHQRLDHHPWQAMSMLSSPPLNHMPLAPQAVITRFGVNR